MAYQTPRSKMQRAWLRRWAGKYVWWKTPQAALQQPQRILAQVMALGEYTDAQTMVEVFGEDALSETLRQAEVGQFDARSWAYWHYRLRLAEPGRLPPLPQRQLPSAR